MIDPSLQKVVQQAVKGTAEKVIKEKTQLDLHGRVAKFVEDLKSQSSKQSYKMLPGTQRLQFNVRTLTELEQEVKSPNEHQSLRNRFQAKNQGKDSFEPTALSLLAFNNPNTVIEFKYRNADALRSRARSAVGAGESLTVDPIEYPTREFLDVWFEGSDKPHRYDISDMKESSILDLVCESRDQDAPPRPLPTQSTIPLQEGEELDAYIARMNLSWLANARSSGLLATLKERRDRATASVNRRVALKKEVRKKKKEETKASNDEVEAAEGLEFLTLDAELNNPPVAAESASSGELNRAPSTADEYEHSAAAWEAIEKRLQEASASNGEAAGESKTP